MRKGTIKLLQRNLLVVGFVLALFVAISWSLFSSTDRAAKDVPVVIYIIDTLRADRLGAYGYDRRVTSPTLDALAAESVMFEQAYAPESWTLPSVTSIFTSTFVCEHGVTARKKLHRSMHPLAERLDDLGYFTGAIVTNPHIGPRSGLDRGFDLFRSEDQAQNAIAGPVKDVLNNVPGRKFFLYLHTMEPHDIYATPSVFIQRTGWVDVDTRSEIEQSERELAQLHQADFMQRLPLGTLDTAEPQKRAMNELESNRDSFELLYDAAVLSADKNLADVIDVLKEKGIWDDAIFIVMSDHGEEMGDHGGWQHGKSVYQEIVHVPLLIRFPGKSFGGTRVGRTVSLIDVMPTILDYLGELGVCEDCRGSSLLPLLRTPDPDLGGQPTVPTIRVNEFYYYRPWSESRGNVNVVIREGAWKGIWAQDIDKFELFDIERDPAEKIDLSSKQPDLSLALQSVGQSSLQDCLRNKRLVDEAEELDDETRQRLESLGYFE